MATEPPSTRIATTGADPLERASDAPLRVLFVTPDAAGREAAGRAFAEAGMACRAAGSDAEAIDLLTAWSPSLILIDLMLPDGGGYDLCRKLRAERKGQLLPILLVGTRSQEDMARAEDAGATTAVERLEWRELQRNLWRVIRLANMQAALDQSERRINALLQVFPDMIFIMDRSGRILDQLGRLESSIDGRPLNLQGITLQQMLPPEVVSVAEKSLEQLFATGQVQTYEHRYQRHDFETRMALQPDDTVLVILRDITQRRQAETRIHRLAFYDQLTGLPNRELLTRTLRSAIVQSAGEGRQLALLYVDLDRFKRINDTFGHPIGDAVLRSVAHRLKSCVRRESTGSRGRDRMEQQPTIIARLSGDEFVVLLQDIGDSLEVESVAGRIQAALSTPSVYDQHRFVVTPSIGIALYPQDGDTAAALLTSADAAMYRAKAEGRNTYCFYSSTMLARSLERLDIENALRSAIRREQLVLHYQPKVDLATWSIVGVEALLRWHHPQRGWIPPTEFIPIAEESGLIVALGEWVLDEACRQLGEWHARGHNISISINVSSQQFRVGDFASRVVSTVETLEVPPERLELEITESLLMRNVDESVTALDAIRDAGIRISVDDFGTGYSSLSYLKHFPLDSLKIDRSFVRDLATSRDDAAICAAIIAMANELGLKVIAEGVETAEQLDFLRHHACDQIQGFYFSKPLPLEAMEELLENHRPGNNPYDRLPGETATAIP